jgi:activator of HSP90 ATPase
LYYLLYRSEKNASNWSKETLTRLLKEVKVDDASVGVVEVTELTSLDGEAVANNRKAKLIFFYEWNIKGKWKGLRNGDVDEVKGTFEITNLSEENEPSEVEILVSVKSKSCGPSADVLKELMRKKGADAIREKLGSYIDLLKSDFAKDLIKPTKDSNGSTTASITPEPKVTTSKLQVNNGISSNMKNMSMLSSPSVGVKIDTKTLSITEELKCRKEEIYRSFIQPELVAAFTRGPVTIDPIVNGKFALFDGNVTGHFTSLKTDEEIQQKWRFKSWPDEHYSDVTLTFSEKADCTEVSLKQTGIPSSDFERTERGWRQMYFHAIKQTFGFGSILY